MTKILFPEGASSSASISGEVGSTSSKMNYSRFITSFAARRQPSIIRELNRPFPPGMLTILIFLKMYQHLSCKMVIVNWFSKEALWAYLFQIRLCAVHRWQAQPCPIPILQSHIWNRRWTEVRVQGGRHEGSSSVPKFVGKLSKFTVVSYQKESFSSKWELPTCSLPPS